MRICCTGRLKHLQFKPLRHAFQVNTRNLWAANLQWYGFASMTPLHNLEGPGNGSSIEIT